MKKIIYLLLCMLTMVSCHTTKKVVKEDLEEIHTISSDSTGQSTLQIEVVDHLERHIVTYDSIITHITILRYDTIVQYGEPVIKERIEIDQVQISREQNEEESGDSLSISKIEQSNISNNDSLRIEEHKTEKTTSVSRRNLAIFIFFLLSILPITFLIRTIKNKP